jgi:hypothetical protein
MRELTLEEMEMVTGGSVDPKYGNCPWILDKGVSPASGGPVTGPNGSIGSVGETLRCNPSGSECTVTAGGQGGASYGDRVGQCFVSNWRGDMRDSVMGGLVSGAQFGFGAGNLGAPGVGGVAGAVGGAAIGGAGAAIAAPIGTAVLCGIFPSR